MPLCKQTGTALSGEEGPGRATLHACSRLGSSNYLSTPVMTSRSREPLADTLQAPKAGSQAGSPEISGQTSSSFTHADDVDRLLARDRQFRAWHSREIIDGCNRFAQHQVGQVVSNRERGAWDGNV